ncbi:polyphosphate kinase 2 [Microbacterium trichothecenolyticum]|nr:polyphosphate kinase 2 [Microbacterium trichothecenolyticum]
MPMHIAPRSIECSTAGASAGRPGQRSGKAADRATRSSLRAGVGCTVTEMSQSRLPKKIYERELRRLQAQLVDMQAWVQASGARVVVIFEGRDAAGKGSTIKRVGEYLNPRVTRTVALPTPTEREKTQWYFQRYVPYLPAAGEIVLMDRSWYNRAGVEHVMGYCTNAEYHRFLHQAPIFERMLVEDGVILLKYWFSVSPDEQEARFRSRADDPMRRWKLSPNDVLSITRWEDYSRAKDTMFVHTDIPEAPWFEVPSVDKRRSRINMISHLLASIPYELVPREEVAIPIRPGSRGYERPPRNLENYVPDVAAEMERAAHSDD